MDLKPKDQPHEVQYPLTYTYPKLLSQARCLERTHLTILRNIGFLYNLGAKSSSATGFITASTSSAPRLPDAKAPSM